MDTTFSFLGLTAHAYGLCATAAAVILLAGMILASRRRGLPGHTVCLFGVMGIPLGVMGARAVYCLFNLSSFTETYENPWLMLHFFDGGFSMAGLFLGLIAAAAIAARVSKAHLAALADVMCVPMGLALAILRFGERFTDLGVGKAVAEGWWTEKLPWIFLQSRMGVATVYCLNVWAYEAATGVAVFVATLIMYRRRQSREGDTALFFFSLFGAAQILLESLRDDGHMLLIFLRVGQLAAALMPLVCLGILTRRYARVKDVGKARLWLSWLVMALCVAGIVLLEFSLDGRVTWGVPSMGRDYAIMAMLCALMFAMPCSLLRTLEREGRMTAAQD